jgi:hypothetical protein
LEAAPTVVASADTASPTSTSNNAGRVTTGDGEGTSQISAEEIEREAETEEPEAALYSEKAARTAEIEEEEVPLGAMQEEADEEQGLRLLWGLLILIIFIVVSARILYKNSKQKNN